MFPNLVYSDEKYSHRETLPEDTRWAGSVYVLYNHPYVVCVCVSRIYLFIWEREPGVGVGVKQASH